jgi:uncharacterized protein Yka (UPF0111/DUF47 family)
MTKNQSSAVSRLVERVFPRTPNFYGLINEQCDLAVQALEVFVDFLGDGDPQTAQAVRALEKEGDDLKRRNLDILNKAFSTPMDREDIYRAIHTVDHIINYAKTTVRELETLGIGPDSYMQELGKVLLDGVSALQRGYGRLAVEPPAAEEDAQAVRKAERTAEKVYRRALAELFHEENVTREAISQQSNGDTLCDAMGAILNVLKRREVYRHLSNAGDRLARAGDVLHDIVVKIS